MEDREIRILLASLTREEKIKLNEMLKALEQKRPPSPTQKE